MPDPPAREPPRPRPPPRDRRRRHPRRRARLASRERRAHGFRGCRRRPRPRRGPRPARRRRGDAAARARGTPAARPPRPRARSTRHAAASTAASIVKRARRRDQPAVGEPVDQGRRRRRPPPRRSPTSRSLLLSPSTSQNGVALLRAARPSTVFLVRPSSATRHVGAASGVGRPARSPRRGHRPGRAPSPRRRRRSRARARRRRCRCRRPRGVCTQVVTRGRATGSPTQGSRSTGRPATGVGGRCPTSRTGTGSPSSVSRSSRHAAGSEVGVTAARARRGCPTSAIATGITIGWFSWYSIVVHRSHAGDGDAHVVAGDAARTSPARSWCTSGADPSSSSGRSTTRDCPPASMRTCVGTECRPSCTTCRSRWSKVTGCGVLHLDPLPGRVAERRCSTGWPGRRRTRPTRATRRRPGGAATPRTVTPPASAPGTPSTRSSTSSGAPVASRTVPPNAKSRSSGTRNWRTSASSSWEYRGGITTLRERPSSTRAAGRRRCRRRRRRGRWACARPRRRARRSRRARRRGAGSRRTRRCCSPGSRRCRRRWCRRS